MVRESQTPRVTQIQVRVDCNGCVQKIKKALNDIHGIHDLRVDFHQQKLTIIGWADPEKVVNAIQNKTRKNATICSNVELTSDATQPEPELVQAQAQAQARPPSETRLEQPPHEASPSTPTPHNTSHRWQNNPETEGVEQAHMMNHHLPNYINRFSYGHSYVEQWDRHHCSPVFLQEPYYKSICVTHSYNTYMPSPYITEYENVRSPSRHTHYNPIEHYTRDYHDGNINFMFMFSDDNPNACCIV